MSETENLQIVSPVRMGKNSFLSASGLFHLTDNRNCLNRYHCASDESRRSHAGNGETSYLDIAVDPEEEAFLQSLGWDKNAGEEALTKEEIDAFLKKVTSFTSMWLILSLFYIRLLMLHLFPIFFFFFSMRNRGC